VSDPELSTRGARIGELLKARAETIAIAEGSCGGLISATLLEVPGASAYYIGGAVIYTFAAKKGLLGDVIETPEGLRGATEEFAQYLARAIRARLETTWGIGEAGAAGPPNRYGDPAGHAWLAVAGPAEATRHVLTGVDDRSANMVSFAVAALDLLLEHLT
jgi:PncC family amidohydrolase